jgi:hypothetical protein
MPRRSVILTLLAMLAAVPHGPAAWANSGGMRAPHAGGSRRPPLGTALAPGYLAIARQPAEAAAVGPFTALLEFYRTVISPVDGDRCEMAPTCSLYALQAFKHHGVAMGFLLTADRLLHEADEKPAVRSYMEDGKRYYLDPLAANTYWLPAWMR